MAEHSAFSVATDMAVYFADPERPGSAAAAKTLMAHCASASRAGPT